MNIVICLVKRSAVTDSRSDIGNYFAELGWCRRADLHNFRLAAFKVANVNFCASLACARSKAITGF